MRFSTTILQGDKTATGIRIPDEIMTGLGAGRKPPGRVTINGHSYRSTVATVDGRPMVGISAANRAGAGGAGGEGGGADLELASGPVPGTAPADHPMALP